MAGDATQAQIAGFLVALRAKGETAEEIAGCAEAMREHVAAGRAARGSDLVDTAGTGGDGANTLNISTAAALVAAAAGAGVAKHGNRAASSATRRQPTCSRRSASSSSCRRSGSRARSTSSASASCSRQAHHPAMRHAAPVRRELGDADGVQRARPADEPGAARARRWSASTRRGSCRTIAEALVQLGARRAFVVHGAGGIDELSPLGPEPRLRGRRRRGARRTIDPQELGIDALRPGRAARRRARRERARLREVLEGARGGRRSAVAPERGRRDRRRRPRRRPARGHRARTRGDRLGRGARPARAAGRVLAGGGAGVRFADALAAPGLARSPSSSGARRRPASCARTLTWPRSRPRTGTRAPQRSRCSSTSASPARSTTSGPRAQRPRAAARQGLLPTAEAELRELKEAGADAALLILRDLDDGAARA